MNTFALVSFFLCVSPAFAQTSFEEPELDFSGLDTDVQVVCRKRACELDPTLNRTIRFEDIHKRPVGNARISSDYGWRMHPILQEQRFHHGVDFAVSVGTPVRAAEAGKIIFAGHKGGYGKFLVIKHDTSYSTVYGHLDSFISGIQVGTFVTKNQVVALSGNTGRSTGPHLHFEVRKSGLALNPSTGNSGSTRVLVLNQGGTETINSSKNITVKRLKNGRIRTVLR